jgi:hypothetical protein
MRAGEKSGSLLYFWRGARRKDRRWWGSLAEPPPRKTVSRWLIALCFVIGVAGMTLVWLAWESSIERSEFDATAPALVPIAGDP